MTAIKIENFGGMVPRLSDRLLPNNYAAETSNAKLQSGELRGVHREKFLEEIGDDRLWAFRIPDGAGQLWIDFFGPGDAISNPLAEDAFDRYYWSDDANQHVRFNTRARIAAGDPEYFLGCPTPTTAPTVMVTGGGTPVSTRAYVYSFVNIYGDESGPSPPTVASGAASDTWTLSDLETGNPPNVVGKAPFEFKKIYRTQTGASGVATFKFVAQIDYLDTTYVDTVSDTDVALNEDMDITLWAEPPIALKNIIMHPNGFAAGFVDNALYLSVPFRVHAWPAEYVLSTEYPIVGLGVFGNSISVMTEVSPYLATGTQPQALTLTDSRVVEPCLAKSSIVNILNGTYYASQNGLVAVHQGGVDIVTNNLISQEEWVAEYKPQDIIAARYQTMYLALNDPANSLGFKIDTQEERIAIVDIDWSDYQQTGWLKEDVYTGNVMLFYTELPSGIPTQAAFWDDTNEPRVQWTWRSKEFHLAKPVNLGACLIAARPSTPTPGGGNPVENQTITLKAFILPAAPPTDPNTAGALVEVYNQVIEPNVEVSLPSGFKSAVWQFELSSMMDVYSMQLAETKRELTVV